MPELVEDFAAVRTANLRMFKVLRPEQWAASGVANGTTISVRALAYVMVGDVRHHLAILRERYDVNDSVIM